MCSSRLLSVALRAGLFLGICASRALPATIQYQAQDINPAQDLWQYNYSVSGTTFAVNEGFTIFFDYHSFSNLQNPQPAASSDWNVIDLQPDPNLPDNGAYDALALVNDPSLASTFQVQFNWLGSGTPGSQPFTINQFDSAGNLVAVLETGNTVPLAPPSTVPEPRAGLLLIAGVGALLLWRRARRRTAPLIVLLALACVGPLSAQQFHVMSRNLVSSTRFSRTQFDYTYTVTIQNTGAAAITVTATVTSSSPDTLVIMGDLRFGDVPAGGTVTSTNTMMIRQNRLVPFDPSALSYQFQTGSGPVANAGPDQVVSVGQTAQLDGSGSFDPNGTIVQYSWTYIGSVPGGIPLSISDPSAVKPTVVISQGGTFTLQLVVTDNHGAVSQPALTHLRTGPIANAGGNQTVNVGQTVQLDGSGSSDPSGLPLTFLWTLSAPSGSSARLSDPAAVKPTFVADVAGDYTASLTVNNGIATSAPASVTITAISGLLMCGDVVSGVLRVPGQQDTYRFAAVAGDVVLISVAGNAAGGAVAEVYDPSGALLKASAANGTTGPVALQANGTYTILVRSNSPLQTQDYGLSLQFTKGECGVSMVCGQSATGVLGTFAEHQSYRFSASSGDVVLISVAGNAAGGAVAEVYDPSGALLKASAANGTTGPVALQANGTYTILVRSNSPLQTQDYGLSLQFTKGECGASIACGQSLGGQLSTFAAYQPYRFMATSGSVVLISVAGNAAGGAVAELYDPSGALLKASTANGTTGTLTLEANGTYTILVRSGSPLQTQNYGVSLACTTSALRTGPRTEESGKYPSGIDGDIRTNADVAGGYTDYSVAPNP